MDPVRTQLSNVQRRYPGATIEVTPEGQQILAVPDVPTGVGWSRDRVTIRVLIPVGFPNVKLDCFYTEADLKLASGAEPGNSSMQAVFGGSHRWFSWHVNSWDPSNDGLDQFLRFCERRLREVR